VPAPYRGVLFDLFGTLVSFDVQRLPELDSGRERVRTTVGALRDVLAEWAPGVSPWMQMVCALTRTSLPSLASTSPRSAMLNA